AVDPLMLSVRGRPQMPFLAVQQQDRADLVDDREFRLGTVYREHYRAMEVEHFAFLFPSDKAFGEGGMAGFLLGRHEHAPPFEAERLARLHMVEGALRAALRRVQRTQALLLQRDALAT